MRSSSNGLNLWSFGQRKGSADRLKGVFKSHRNVKNFVGLSALRGEGLIACGSEDNELYVYERSESKPLWRMKFPSFLDQESSPPSPSSSSSSPSSCACACASRIASPTRNRWCSTHRLGARTARWASTWRHSTLLLLLPCVYAMAMLLPI